MWTLFFIVVFLWWAWYSGSIGWKLGSKAGKKADEYLAKKINKFFDRWR